MLLPETYMSTQEAAAELGLTDGRIRQMLCSDPPEIRAQKLGKHAWAIPRSEVERLKRLRTPQSPVTTTRSR